mmetsp:Transcript_2698/g.5703  ORF Transcript_2698/g.5703 Transcript_2698/m.5703 type:complete len:204 (+) Transcript_2698:413-1024(+)
MPSTTIAIFARSDSCRTLASSAALNAAASAASASILAFASASAASFFAMAAASSFALAAARASALSLSRWAFDLGFVVSTTPPASASALASAFSASLCFASRAFRCSSGSSSTTSESASASWSRYSSNSPLKGITEAGSSPGAALPELPSPGSMTQISLHTALISDMLCVITITPPLKFCSAVTRQSTVSRSRWLVGSSSSSK